MNATSKLTGNGPIVPSDVSGGLGTVGSGLGIYDALTNPASASGVLGGLSGAANLANTANNVATGAAPFASATGSLGDITGALGAAGAGLGLYGAIQNPNNPLNDLNGALDANKLYNFGSGLASSLGGSGSSAGALAGSGAGIDTAGLESVLPTLGGDVGGLGAAAAGTDAALGTGAIAGDLGTDAALAALGGDSAIDTAGITALGDAVGADAVAGAGTGALGAVLGTVGTIAPYLLPALALGYGIYSLTQGPPAKDTINTNKVSTTPGDTTIDLQAGTPAILNGVTPGAGVAFGSGASRGLGGAQWFLDPAMSGTLDYNGTTGQQNFNDITPGANSVIKGNPYWLGGADSQALTDFANGVGPDAASLVNGQPSYTAAESAYEENPNSSSGLTGIYNDMGGEATWGENFNQWLNSIWTAENGMSGNLSTGG